MIDARQLSPELVDCIAQWERGEARGDRVPALHVFELSAARPAGSTGRTRDEQLNVARSAFSGGYPTWAVAATRAMVAHEPDDAEASLLLCAFLLRRGEAEAGQWIQRCMARCLDPSPGWIGIGDILLERNQKEAALLCFGKAPPSAALAIRCGLLARDLGQLRDALAWLTRAVRLDPLNERGWFLLGTCAEATRDFVHAADAYRTVLRLNPARVEAEVNLGMVLQEAGDLPAAKRCYARAVHARPDTFARVAQALTGSPQGELWLDLAALRHALAG